MRTLITLMPEWVKNPLRRLRDIVWPLVVCYYYGNGRFCPVCGKSSRRFRHFGVLKREDAQCVHCKALERHRFTWLYLLRNTDLFNGKPKKMLHVAPESCFESRLRNQLGDQYITADLFNPNAMVKMDITNIECSDKLFDVIYCSHVLEHVQDDKRAMREFYRVLKNDGWAILLVPITSEKTFEDPLIVDPLERIEYFGKEDHVRNYGWDYIDRLSEAGFNVKVSRVNDLVQGNDAKRMGLNQNSGEIYYCTK